MCGWWGSGLAQVADCRCRRCIAGCASRSYAAAGWLGASVAAQLTSQPFKTAKSIPCQARMRGVSATYSRPLCQTIPFGVCKKGA